jgi:hypothetical protein
MAVDQKPLESDFGFRSPNFTVDEEGNVVVKSLSYVSDNTQIEVTEDYKFSNAGTDFVVLDATGAPLEGQNPAISLIRGETYVFELSLSASLTFSILNEAGDATYDIGIGHKSLDGTVETTGADAQGKRDGFVTFIVPINAPDTLKYGDLTTGTIGTFNIEFATISGIGQFSELVVTGSSSLGPTEIINTTDSTTLGTGSLIVRGGASVRKDLNVGGALTADTINTNGTGYAVFETQTNLEFNVGNKITFKVGGTILGDVTSEGSAVKIVNTTIDNTVIGGTTPTTAAFTSATVSEVPTASTDITNKTYVDLQSAAFAIALGT